ncbi:hypothetical protein [Shewanella sp. M-Br]|uniref:hypothetical protein n=1 Tax=Shewanella sp. M-Br TaxID=2495595 RepID=UPI00294A51A6|nr:hypothetical protein SMBr_14860 [Shewanella sp. M-Br]
MALITRILENADGAQQIAIFDTKKHLTKSVLGLFITINGEEVIARMDEQINAKPIAKLIFMGKKI